MTSSRMRRLRCLCASAAVSSVFAGSLLAASVARAQPSRDPLAPVRVELVGRSDCIRAPAFFAQVGARTDRLRSAVPGDRATTLQLTTWIDEAASDPVSGKLVIVDRTQA